MTKKSYLYPYMTPLQFNNNLSTNNAVYQYPTHRVSETWIPKELLEPPQ